MGGTSRFCIRLCVVLCVFALAVTSQSSDNGRRHTPGKDSEPVHEKCSCRAEVGVNPTGCNATTFRAISSELEDTKRQLQAAVSADKTPPISSELQETRHQVEKLQISVSKSQESVSSELRDIRRQLDELKTSVSTVVDILKDTPPVEEALPNNATGSTEEAPATNKNTFPTDKTSIIDATERSELVTTTETADTFSMDKTSVIDATEKSELVKTTETDTFPTDKTSIIDATERSELVTKTETDTFPTDKTSIIDATEKSELVTTTETADTFPMDKTSIIDATEKSESIVTTTVADTFPMDKTSIVDATEKSELVTTTETDTFPTDKTSIIATERSELVTKTETDTFPMNKAPINDATERSESIVSTTVADIFAKDCSEILAWGVSISGVYTVQPRDSGEAFQVYCDMETDGGGWTVFQRRQDGSVDFYLDFDSYSKGFGNLEGEFWLGNDNLHRLTAQGEYNLRVDLSDFEGSTKYAIYDSFSIAGVKDNYTLKVRGYSGTAGNSMGGLHNNQPFSTKDRDNDDYSGNCAAMFRGAWWYNACHSSNLNGEYLGGLTVEFSRGVNWRSWKGFLYSLKTTEMKIRMKQ